MYAIRLFTRLAKPVTFSIRTTHGVGIGIEACKRLFRVFFIISSYAFMCARSTMVSILPTNKNGHATSSNDFSPRLKFLEETSSHRTPPSIKSTCLYFATTLSIKSWLISSTFSTNCHASRCGLFFLRISRLYESFSANNTHNPPASLNPLALTPQPEKSEMNVNV